MKSSRLLFILSMFLVAQPTLAETLTLSKALDQALHANPEIASRQSKAQADEGLIRSKYWLDNPRFGLMRETNMTPMEQSMGPMEVWSISQPLRFPTKYFLMGSAQSSKAKAEFQKLLATKLQVRHKLITAYYHLYSVQRVIELLKAQRETLRQVARSAEARHAVGSVPQQDEMKAQVEQTKIEAALLMAKEQESTAESTLNALMDHQADTQISLPKRNLMIPALKMRPDEIERIAENDSPEIRSAEFMVNSSQSIKKLAAWNFAPDFTLTYKRAYSNSLPNAYSIGIEISVPLWFFAKQNGEYQAAEKRSAESKSQLDLKRVTINSQIRSLSAKVSEHEQLLQIYKTSLIPQASTTLSSSEGAYRAGKTTFLELLDSERSLYAVRIAYYRTLAEYVDNLTHLEEVTGRPLSDLPTGDSL